MKFLKSIWSYILFIFYFKFQLLTISFLFAFEINICNIERVFWQGALFSFYLDYEGNLEIDILYTRRLFLFLREAIRDILFNEDKME